MSKNLYSVLDFLKKTIDVTMNLEATRFIENPGYGWVNTKVYPHTGLEKKDENNVFTVIQGRALEALAEHLRWYRRFNGYVNPDEKSLSELGKSLNEKIEILVSKYEHVPSVVDATGTGESTDTRTNMADLFCARGLYDWAFLNCDKPQIKTARERLLRVCNDILNSDVRFFGERMLALGGVNLIVRNEGSRSAFLLARKIIDNVLNKHFNDGRWASVPYGLLVYELDSNGAPLIKDEMIQNSAGNSLEFAGLCAQTILLMEDLGITGEKDVDWKNKIIEKLENIISANFSLSYVKGLGFHLLTDILTGNATDAKMPWWIVAEGARACFLVSEFNTSNSERLKNRGFELLNVFEKKYVRQSPIGIAVQMLDAGGNPVKNVPMNPDIDAGFHTGLAFISIYDCLAKKCSLMLSKAQCDITPGKSQLLSGHVARNKPFEYVIDPLLARIIYLRSPYSESVLVSLDLCEVYDNWYYRLAGKIQTELKLADNSVSIASTHTHTGPFTNKESKNTEYINFMMNKVMHSVKEAKKHGIEVNIRIATANSDFGINRRFKDEKTGKIIMRPNPQGSIDNTIPVMAFINSEGKPEAVIYNTAVHPTTIGVDFYAVSADYPGRIGYYLRQEFGDNLVAVPLTGACGDVRPAVLSKDKQKFIDGTPDHVERFGKRTAQSIIKALKNAKDIPSCADCAMFSVTVPFTLTNIPTKETLVQLREKDAELRENARRIYDTLSPFEIAHDNPFWPVDLDKKWVEAMLRKKTIDNYVNGRLFALFINREIAIFFVPGELFSQLGINVKKLWNGQIALLASYSNGNLGYMPSKQAVKEGGYEVECSFKDELLSGPFSENLETELKDGIQSMIDKYKRNLQNQVLKVPLKKGKK